MKSSQLKGFLRKLWKDESAQGATEYILLLVVVVAVIALFRKQIQEKVKQLIENLSGKIDEVAQ